MGSGSVLLAKITGLIPCNVLPVEDTEDHIILTMNETSKS